MVGTGALSPSGAIYTVELGSAPYHATVLTPSINADPNTPLKFDGFGRPNYGGTVLIKVGKDTRTITIEAETGKTQVNS